MNSEVLAGEPREPQARPTELYLFNFRPQERVATLGMMGVGRSLSRDLDVNNRRRLVDDTTIFGRLSKLDAIDSEQQDLINQYSSFRTVSAAYLQMYDDLSPRGIPDIEIFSLFQKSFYMACEFYKLYDPSNNPSQEIAFRKHQAARAAGYPELRRLIVKIAGVPSPSFRKSKTEWEQLIDEYSNFSEMLNPNFNGISTEKLEFGFVSTEWIPDWFADSDGVAPRRSQVEEEFKEDTEEQLAISIYQDKVNSNYNDLREYDNRLFIKSALNIEKRRRDLFPGQPSLVNSLIYLSATQNMYTYPGDIEVVKKMSADELDDIMVSPEESRKSAINIFTEQMPIGSDLVALWLEKQFKDGGFSATTVIDENLVDRLGLIGREKEGDLRALKDTDKKFFKLYYYQLAPLFDLMQSGQKEYMTELIEGSKGEKVELIIWEMADIFASRLQATNEPELNQTVGDIRRFSKKWLTDNWQWAYGELELAAEAGPREIVHPEETVEEELDVTQESKDEEVEMQELSRQVKEGNLAGWSLFYTTNMRVKHGGKLLAIDGKDLDDKEKALGKVLTDEGSQVAIKNSSLIHALDWITTVPMKNLKRQMLEVNGEVFMVRKRDSVRILFQIDHESKELSFFLVPAKRGWEYGIGDTKIY